MIKSVPVAEAVGMVLGHDVTRIVPGESKGPAFKRGHIIQAEEVDALLDIGKGHVYVVDLGPDLIHEDEAACRIAQAAAGPGIRLTKPSEGKVNFIAEISGLLKVNVPALTRLNAIDEVVLATLHTNHRTEAGRAVAGTRIIPPGVSRAGYHKGRAPSQGQLSAGGGQALSIPAGGHGDHGQRGLFGRIKDAFGPVVEKKFRELGSTVFRQALVSDDLDMTVAAIHDLIAEGAQMVALTGGMSVDPDDQTPAAIRAAGAEVITYGAPVFPGAMFMLAYIGGIPVVGLPGCVMYYKASIFDLVIPRLLAGETVTQKDIEKMGHGGFCAGCSDCRYPLCGFGKCV